MRLADKLNKETTHLPLSIFLWVVLCFTIALYAFTLNNLINDKTKDNKPQRVEIYIGQQSDKSLEVSASIK